MSLPFKRKEKKSKENQLQIQIYIPTYRYQNQQFLNMETQETEQHEVWKFCSLVYANTIFDSGRRTKDVDGKPSLTSKAFGFKAVSQACTDLRFPLSEKECERLITEGINSQIPHLKLILLSDLYPCSPFDFKEKNYWLAVANLENTDVINRKINLRLREINSPLRIQSSLKHKIVEA